MLPIANSPFNPLIASPAAAENPGDKNLRQMTWLLAMEKQQLAEWLSHPFSDSAPSSSSPESAAENKSGDVDRNLFGAGAQRFLLRTADDEDSGSGGGDATPVPGSDAHRTESDGRVSGKNADNDMTGSGRAAHASASAPVAHGQSLADLQGAVIGGTSAKGAPDEAEATDEAAAASKDSGDRLVTISSDLQKLLSDLGLTKFQVGAAYAPPDDAENALLPAAPDEDDIESDASDARNLASTEKNPASAGKAAESFSPPDSQKLRLHAEIKNDEAHVWIGADRSLQLTGKHLDALTDQLQQLFNEQGTPLTSLIFNGRSLIAMPSGDAARRNQKLQGNTESQPETGDSQVAELDNEHFMRKP